MHKDLLQGRLVDLCVLDAEAEGRVLQQLEHRRELPLGLRLRHEDSVLVRELVMLLFNPDILLSRLLVRVYKLIEPLFLIDLQFDAAPRAKSFRQEGSAALAHKLTCRHNADSVAEDFSFVHVMRGQYDHSILLIGLKHIPHAAPGSYIETCCRLIKQNQAA